VKSGVFFAGGTVAAILAGLIVGVGVYTAERPTQMVVSTRDIGAYTPIAPNDVKVVSVSGSLPLPDVAHSLAQVIGKYVGYAIPAGYPVEASSLTYAPSFSGFLTQYTQKHNTTGALVALASTSPLDSVVHAGDEIGLIVPQQGGHYITYAPLKVLGTLGGSNPTLMIYVPSSEYGEILPAVEDSSAQVEIIPQDNTFVATLPSTITSAPPSVVGTTPAPSGNTAPSAHSSGSRRGHGRH